jgi:hypothetical protein
LRPAGILRSPCGASLRRRSTGNPSRRAMTPIQGPCRRHPRPYMDSIMAPAASESALTRTSCVTRCSTGRSVTKTRYVPAVHEPPSNLDLALGSASGSRSTLTTMRRSCRPCRASRSRSCSEGSSSSHQKAGGHIDPFVLVDRPYRCLDLVQNSPSRIGETRTGLPECPT